MSFSTVSGQSSHGNIFGVSRLKRLSSITYGFVFFAVGAHEFIVELEVYPHAGVLGILKEAAWEFFTKQGIAEFPQGRISARLW